MVDDLSDHGKVGEGLHSLAPVFEDVDMRFDIPIGVHVGKDER